MRILAANIVCLFVFFVISKWVIHYVVGARSKSITFKRFVKHTDVKCYTDHPEQFDYIDCGLLSDDIGKKMSIIWHLKVPIIAVLVRVRLMRKHDGYYSPSMIDITVDGCEVTKDKIRFKKTPAGKLFLLAFNKYTNAYISCPITEKYIYLNRSLDKNFMAPAEFPAIPGELRVDVIFMINHKNNANMSIFYKLL